MEKNVEKYIKEWEASRQYVYGFTRDFKDLDTIANAQYPKGTSRTPNVGDTTVAGTIRQMMRSAVKDLPVVQLSVNGTKKTMEAILSNFIVKDRILNPNTFSKGFVSTLKLGGRGALTRGFNVFQVATTKKYGEFGVVPRLIHFSDIGIEPGVQDANLSSYFYIRTQYTPDKINSIYRKEKRNRSTTWNIKALKALIDAGPNGNGPSEYAEYIIPSQTNVDNTDVQTYDLITRIPADPSEDIVTFSCGIYKALRVVSNKSKFGYPRVLFLVIDEAELSPLGDSRVRLASPDQNLAMALRRNVATTWMYNSNPTLVETGMFMGATALKAGGRIKSTDPNAKITPLPLDTSTAQQYPTISQEITGQILNMLGYNPNRALGAIGESKTGIGAQTQRMNIDDGSKEITNNLESFIKQYVLSAFDLYMSEQDGDDIIYVDDETREEILRVKPVDSNGKPTFSDPENPNALGINWNDLYDYIKKIDVEVSVTMSKDDFTNEKRADLQDAVTVMSQTADRNDPDAMNKVKHVQEALLDTIDPNLLPDQPAQQPQPQQMPPSFVG